MVRNAPKKPPATGYNLFVSEKYKTVKGNLSAATKIRVRLTVFYGSSNVDYNVIRRHDLFQVSRLLRYELHLNLFFQRLADKWSQLTPKQKAEWSAKSELKMQQYCRILDDWLQVSLLVRGGSEIFLHVVLFSF